MSAMNPILAELNGLSPGAKAALQSAHQATQPPNPQIQAYQQQQRQQTPEPAPIQMPTPSQAQVPQMGMPSTPNVKLAPQPKGTLIGDKEALQQEAGKKPALESVYSGISHSQFGEHHPVLGKLLGAAAQIPATAADVSIGSLPRLGALVPGTSVNHGLQLKGLENRIAGEEKNQQEEATTGAENARTEMEQAEAAALPGQEATKQALTYAQIQHLLSPEATNAWEGYAQAERAAGREPDVAKFFQMQSAAKAPSNEKEQLQRALVDAENKGDKAGAAKLRQQIKDIDPLGEQRLQVTVQGQQNQQQRARDQKTESEYTWTRNDFDKQLQTYGAQNDKLQEAEGFIGKGALGDALASIKSLSGLASGQGSGVRITQAELNAIVHSRGLGGDFQAAMQRFGDGKSLTPQQEQQLRGILEDVQKIASAKEAVINKVLDDLGDAPDQKTIRQIYSQARHALIGGQ